MLGEGTDGSRAADVDDRRVLRLAQLIEGGAHAEKSAQTIDPPGVFEVFSRLVGQRRPGASTPALLTSVLSSPKRPTARSTAASPLRAGEVTSSWMPITSLSPSSPIAAAPSSLGLAGRQAATGKALRIAALLAMAQP